MIKGNFQASEVYWYLEVVSTEREKKQKFFMHSQEMEDLQ